ADFLLLGAPFSSTAEGVSERPGSTPPATAASGKFPSAVFSTHLAQSPSGASEKIFAPHFRQILITLIIVESFAHAPFCTPEDSFIRYASSTAMRWRNSSSMSPGVATV